MNVENSRHKLEGRRDILDLLKLFWINRRLIIIFTFSATFLSAFVSLIIPKQYESTAVIMPIQKHSNPRGIDLLRQSGGIGELLNMGMVAQETTRFQEFLESLEIATKVAKQENLLINEEGQLLDPTERERFIKDLRDAVEVSVRSEVIEIKYQNEDATQARDVVQAYLGALRNFMQTDFVSQARNTEQFIEARLKEMEAKLSQIQGKYIDLQIQRGVVQLPTQLQHTLNTASELRKQLVEKDMEIAQYRDVMRNETELQRLLAERRRIKDQLGNIISGESESDADGKSSSDVEIFTPLNKAPALEKEVAEAERLYLSQTQLVDLLRQQLELTRIEAKKDEPVFQIIDPPKKALIPSWPKKKLITIIGTIMGFIIGIVAVLFLNQYKALMPILKQAENAVNEE